MKPVLRVLVLSDGRPGHFNQSRGVCAALALRFEVKESWFEVSRASKTSGALRRLLAGTKWVPRAVLDWAVQGDLSRIEALVDTKPDLIVSAGGNTLPLNAILARRLGVANLFCGSIRNLAHDNFRLILHTDPARTGEPRTHVGLKPTPVGPDREFSIQRPAKRIAVLIGGPTDVAPMSDSDLDRLLEAVEAGDWTVTFINAPRTPVAWTQKLKRCADGQSAKTTLLDFENAPKTALPTVLNRVDAALVTADSASMITDCVAAQLPTVALVPKGATFGTDAGYFDDLIKERRVVALDVEELSIQAVEAGIKSNCPATENHLESLLTILDQGLALDTTHVITNR